MKPPVVAVVGERRLRYASHAVLDDAFANAPVEPRWLDTRTLETRSASALAAADGILMAPGGYASFRGALEAVAFAREERIPLTGA